MQIPAAECNRVVSQQLIEGTHLVIGSTVNLIIHLVIDLIVDLVIHLYRTSGGQACPHNN